MVFSFRLFLRCVLAVLALMLALPVSTVLFSWAQWNDASASILAEMASTVLPDYVGTSLLMCVLVSVGVISMGTVSAAAVTLFDFPMRSSLEWALLLPLAMPAYVVAYAYTDYLQFSGPLQSSIRAAFGLEGRVFPEVRNVWGAACVFTLALFPYVYLLARTALSERANHLMEAARLLGAPLSRRILRVALPLARPAIAAGTALALMETLADFGVSSYFGIQTFTAGIYKAWLVMDNRIAAEQLATLLLVVVIVLSLIHGAPLLEMIPLMLILLMSAVPVALPVMFTVSMAVGSKELAKRGVLVTRLSAAEDAATMDVLCVDKTGTITMNQLAVTGVIPLEHASESDVLCAGEQHVGFRRVLHRDHAGDGQLVHRDRTRLVHTEHVHRRGILRSAEACDEYPALRQFLGPDGHADGEHDRQGDRHRAHQQDKHERNHLDEWRAADQRHDGHDGQ